LLLNLDATTEAYLVYLPIRKVVHLFEAKCKVFISQLSKQHFQLTCNDEPCEVFDVGSIYGNLHLEQLEDVVERVKASHRLDGHEVGDVDESFSIEVLEVCVLVEDVPVLQVVSWECVFFPEDCDKGCEIWDVLRVDMWITYELGKVTRENQDKLLGRG
jgi:hypothetical protein